jgi:hypothetical protein
VSWLETSKETKMAQESANPSTKTVRLHRVLAAKPDKVFRAFTTPDGG